MIYIAGIFIIGLLVGIITTELILRAKSTGTLILDNSDPEEKTLLFLELSVPPEQIYTKEFIKLRIKGRNFDPHK